MGAADKAGVVTRAPPEGHALAPLRSFVLSSLRSFSQCFRVCGTAGAEAVGGIRKPLSELSLRGKSRALCASWRGAVHQQ
jgi:hypothetical protein